MIRPVRGSGRFVYLFIHQDFDEILIVARIGIDVQPGRIRPGRQVRLTGVKSIRAKPPLYSNTIPSSRYVAAVVSHRQRRRQAPWPPASHGWASGLPDSALGVRVTFAERSAVSGLSCTVTVSVVSPSGTFRRREGYPLFGGVSTAALQVIPRPKRSLFTLWPAAPSAAKVSAAGSTVSE